MCDPPFARFRPMQKLNWIDEKDTNPPSPSQGAAPSGDLVWDCSSGNEPRRLLPLLRQLDQARRTCTASHACASCLKPPSTRTCRSPRWKDCARRLETPTLPAYRSLQSRKPARCMMEGAGVSDKLLHLFAHEFNLDPEALSEESSPETVEQWDSLAAMR